MRRCRSVVWLRDARFQCQRAQGHTGYHMQAPYGTVEVSWFKKGGTRMATKKPAKKKPKRRVPTG